MYAQDYNPPVIKPISEGEAQRTFKGAKLGSGWELVTLNCYDHAGHLNRFLDLCRIKNGVIIYLTSIIKL